MAKFNIVSFYLKVHFEKPNKLYKEQMNEINYNFKNVVYTARFILFCDILINLKSFPKPFCSVTCKARTGFTLQFVFREF